MEGLRDHRQRRDTTRFAWSARHDSVARGGADSDDDLQASIVVEHYDDVAARYSSLYAGTSPVSHFYHARMRCLDQVLADVPGGVLLEIGCATGQAVDRLTSRGFRYYGVDISPGMIEECRKKFADLTAASFNVGDLRSLDFPDGHFDVVVCLGALEYVADEQSAIREMCRVLKESGYLILSGNNGTCPYNLWTRGVYRKVTHRYPPAILHEFHVERDYLQMLEDAGMSHVDSAYFDFAVFPPPLDDLFPRAATYFGDRLGRLDRARLRKLGRGFLVKAKKRATEAFRHGARDPVPAWTPPALSLSTRFQASGLRLLSRVGVRLHPTDEVLIARFRMHAGVFEEIKSMLEADSHLGYVGQTRTRVVGEPHWRSADDPGIPQVRFDRYRDLLRQVGVQGASHVGRSITMRASTVGRSLKGFVYVPMNTVLVSTLDVCPLPREGHAHRALEDSWYLVLGWE